MKARSFEGSERHRDAAAGQGHQVNRGRHRSGRARARLAREDLLNDSLIAVSGLRHAGEDLGSQLLVRASIRHSSLLIQRPAPARDENLGRFGDVDIENPKGHALFALTTVGREDLRDAGLRGAQGENRERGEVVNATAPRVAC